MLRWRTLLAVAAALTLLPAVSRAADFLVTPLVVDDPGVLAPLGFSGTPLVDPNLVNPWGVSFSATSPAWVSDNNPSLAAPPGNPGLTFASLYALNGPQAVLRGQFAVPDTTGGGANLTGQVFNGGGSKVFGGNVFLFASETGGIYGFNGKINTLYAQNTNDVFKGLALANVAGVPTLLATNFRQGTVDAFANTGFNAGPPPSLSRTGQLNPFATDKSPLPTADPYAPFNIAQLANGKIYVTFAVQNAAKHDDVAGPGHGFVDVLSFDASGNPTFTRLITGGVLNSPWGLVIAPATFPKFGGDLLVGNFGDGEINAFDPNTGAFLGTLDGPDGNPLMIPGLWALWFGTGGSSGQAGRLFFTAGVPGPNGNGVDPESDGLLGAIDPVPEPGTLGLFLVGGAGLWLFRRRKARPA